MKRTKPLALVAAVLVALVALVSGCGGNDDAVNAPTMLEGSWTLVTLDGAAADAAVPSTLSMNEGTGHRERRRQHLQRQLRAPRATGC